MEAFSAVELVDNIEQPVISEPPLPLVGGTVDTGVGLPLEIGETLPPPSDPFVCQPDPYGLAPSALVDHKEGFFQKLDFQGTWIDNTADGDFSVYSLETYASFAMPLPTRDSPLVISPGFGVHYFEGPPAPHVPPRVYDAYLDFLWLRPVGPYWKLILEVKPGIYSDFESVDSDSFRIQGNGVVLYDALPGFVQLVLGVAYLDRSDVNILPVGGVIWTPTPDQRHELVFPRPKLAYRIDYWFDWNPAESFEDWLYLRAAFGGDQWEYQRLDGTRNTFLLRDYRLVLGLERKRNGGGGMRLEIGYVLGRTLEFAGGLPDADGQDAAFLRGGVTF